MDNFPWLSVMLLVPLVGAALIAALPSALAARAKELALVFSLATLAVGVGAVLNFDANDFSAYQLTEVHTWISSFGASYALGVDGIALSLIVMATILAPVCILAAWNDVPEGGTREKNYFALLLLLLTFMVGVFAASDVFLFYVFFEAMLIPLYFLIGSYGGAGRQAAALKFILFSLAGGLVMLVAVIGLYFQGPRGDQGFLIQNLVGLPIDPTTQKWLFIGFFFAFAVKAPMWPVHTWLPDVAATATPATTTLLVSVLDKIGTYGMIRFCLQLFPDASEWATPVVIALAVVSIYYGAMCAIAQNDLMRLISYTSISHFGLMIMGIFALTTVSNAGAGIYMLNHGFSTAALFLIAGMLIARRRSGKISDFGGWQKVTPLIAGTFLVAGMASLALPGMGPFIGEFLVLNGTFQRYKGVAIVVTPIVVLAAIYILWMYKRMMTGPAAEGAAAADMGWREKFVVAPLILSLLFLGFYPKPALDLINPAVQRVLTEVGVSDPAPVVPATAITGSEK
ncbi:NADH-quinone oxidoreductase subunit M [Nostocoides vanveenii]|uniref:NADH-quinone oxidoreductase subunit M n=1 Tax=Nostocoides vanveenii TaxID=330835 RepID=A0ABP4X112_9MICO